MDEYTLLRVHGVLNNNNRRSAQSVILKKICPYTDLVNPKGGYSVPLQKKRVSFFLHTYFPIVGQAEHKSNMIHDAESTLA